MPVRYLYPSRGAAFQRLTNWLGIVWGGLILVMVSQLPAVSRPLLFASLLFPAYYVVLSLLLEARRRGP